MCPAPRLHCPGPGCKRWVDHRSPHPDFCSHPCAARWRETVLDVAPAPSDGRRGWVRGADYGSGGSSDHNDGLHVLGFAFPWLDARMETT